MYRTIRASHSEGDDQPSLPFGEQYLTSDQVPGWSCPGSVDGSRFWFQAAFA